MVESSSENPKWHQGAWYGTDPPSGCQMDQAAKTSERGRGAPKLWFTDGFNKNHVIDFSSGPDTASFTMAFPIPKGGHLYWQDQAAKTGKSQDWGAGLWGAITNTSGQPYQEKSGFNENITWIQGTFLKEGDNIRFHLTGWFKKGDQPSAGLLGLVKQRFGDVKDIAADVEQIVKSGCNSAQEVIKVYEAMHGKSEKK